ncbi:MAG TPA: HAD-IA family hydrolase [Terriglobales bacterium]|nr:HAD-IA family hydrolase [Terriglobales bacterium]
MIRVRRKIPAETIKLLIFDLDGTLVDSRVDLTNAVNAMLRKFGRVELPMEVVESYVGDGAPMLIRRALGDPDSGDLMREALEYFILYYRQHKLDNTTLYEGVQQALEALRDGGGRKMAVLSNKPVNPSRGICEALGISPFFVQVYGGNSFPTKKPDPQGALALCSETGVRPEQAVIIGDSDIDVLTGQNAGIWTVGVNYGFMPARLKLTPPDVLIDSPSELPDIFKT